MSTNQSKAATTDSKKRRRWPKVLLGVLGGLLAIVAIAWVVAANRPGLVVNAIQSAFHKDGTQANSYEPLDQAADGQDENGVYVRANIAYADEYPNSYLDIRYASDPAAVDSATHPTMVYIHGGGWFYGSKTKGDPMSVESSNYMMDSIVKDGYNLVSMDYALRPDYGFPVPMEQLDQCVRFLQEHAAEYGLDMTNVYFFGQSAGAVMTTQYATLVSNPAYADLMGIHPSLDASVIRAVAIDDAPLDYDDLDFATKVLVGNYLQETTFVDASLVARYNPIPYAGEGFPPALLIASDSYVADMKELHAALDGAGVDNELVYPLDDMREHTHHTYITGMKSDPVAQDTFDRMMTYLDQH